MKLEDLRPPASVRGIALDLAAVTVEWRGADAFTLIYRRGAEGVLYRHDEPRLEVVEQERS